MQRVPAIWVALAALVLMSLWMVSADAQPEDPSAPFVERADVEDDEPPMPAPTVEEVELGLLHSTRLITYEAMHQLETGWGAWSDALAWCEEWYMRPCSSDRGCEGYETCVHPWWAQEADSKVCTEKWPTASTRAWRRDRLRTVVDFSCRRSKGCDPHQLHQFLSLVALRESTWRPAKRHRLNPDIESALRAWRRRGNVFADNSYYAESARWSTGLGLYGQNPAIFVDAWHPEAPPEVLCREVEATAAYLERSRRAVRGLKRRGVEPTICDVHHAVAGGKLEPCQDATRFHARAERIGLDPDAPVSEASFGEAPPRDLAARLAWAEAVHSAVVSVHPCPPGDTARCAGR